MPEADFYQGVYNPDFHRATGLTVPDLADRLAGEVTVITVDDTGEVTDSFDPATGEMTIKVDVAEPASGDYAPPGETIGPPLPSTDVSWLWILAVVAGVYLLSRSK